MKTITNNKKTAVQEMTLEDLLVNKLKALYDIENELVKALPKMAKAASDGDLKKGFETHLKQTEGHVNRIERIFEMMEMKPQKLKCDGIRGIIADAGWVIKNIKKGATLDANLIAAGQYAEHYEIAGYTSAIAWAKLLDQNDAADLLQQTLDEEKETSDELAELADAKIDEEAMGDDKDAADADMK